MEKKEKIFTENLKLSKEIFIIGPLFNKRLSITRKESSFLFIDGGSQFFDYVQKVFIDSLPFEGPLFFNSLKVGDGDSFKGTLDIKLSVNKNYSDLAYGLQLIKPFLEKVSLLGFLGGRKDHELFNLGEIHKVLLSPLVQQSSVFYLDKSFICFPPGAHNTNIEGTFSLFVLEKAKVTITGSVKFPLLNPTTIDPLSSFCLSNICHGEVVIQSDKPIFLYLPTEKGLNE